MILVFAYFLNYYLNRTFALEGTEPKESEKTRSLEFFADPCPEGFVDVDPDSIIEYDTGDQGPKLVMRQ